MSRQAFRLLVRRSNRSLQLLYAWPYESFVISIAHLVNRVVNKEFKIDDLDEIVSENKRLIRTLEKSYSEINKK